MKFVLSSANPLMKSRNSCSGCDRRAVFPIMPSMKLHGDYKHTYKYMFDFHNRRFRFACILIIDKETA